MMEYSYITRKGQARSNNQDNIYANDVYLPESHGDAQSDSAVFDLKSKKGTPSHYSFCVFDGMGGEASGETASWLAASTFQKYDSMLSGTSDDWYSNSSADHIFFQESKEQNPAKTIGIKKKLSRILHTFASFQKANVVPDSTTISKIARVDNIWKLCISMNQAIYTHAQNKKISTTGSTVAGIVFWEDIYIGYNIGDSRLYRYSNGTVTQLSKDHRPNPLISKRKGLTQFLGIPEEEFMISPECVIGENTQKDTFLLCSDGVSDILEPSDFEKILAKEEAIDITLQKMMNLAITQGGNDDKSILLIRPWKRNVHRNIR